MSIQMALMGAETSSQITAQSVAVSEINVGSVSVSATFSNSGSQFTTINGSNTILGNWVAPAASADQWEIRATLDSGATPTGTLGTWLPMTSNQSWGLSRSLEGSSECILTFEFRKVGGSSAEVTIPLNSLQAEVLDIFA